MESLMTAEPDSGDTSAWISVQSVRLCSWIYFEDGRPKASPFGRVEHFQKYDESQGHELQWAIVFENVSARAFLVIRGTSEIADWISNAGISFNRKHIGIPFEVESALLFHSGFWSAVDGASDLLAQHLERVIQAGAKSIVLCGHSRGAACAAIIAARLIIPGLELSSRIDVRQYFDSGSCALSLVLFGAPNIVGNSAANETLQNAFAELPHSTTWINYQDPVPKLLSPDAQTTVSAMLAQIPLFPVAASSSKSSTRSSTRKLVDTWKGLQSDVSRLAATYAFVFPNPQYVGVPSEVCLETHNIDVYGNSIASTMANHADINVRTSCHEWSSLEMNTISKAASMLEELSAFGVRATEIKHDWDQVLLVDAFHSHGFLVFKLECSNPGSIVSFANFPINERMYLRMDWGEDGFVMQLRASEEDLMSHVVAPTLKIVGGTVSTATIGAGMAFWPVALISLVALGRLWYNGGTQLTNWQYLFIRPGYRPVQDSTTSLAQLSHLLRTLVEHRYSLDTWNCNHFAIRVAREVCG